MAVQDFASRSGLTPRAAEAVLEQLAQCRRIRQVVGHVGKEQLWVSEEAYSGLKRRAVEELEALFRRDRLARGMARAEFARRVFPRCAGPLIQRCVAWLEEEKCICVDDGSFPCRGAHWSRLRPRRTSSASSRNGSGRAV